MTNSDPAIRQDTGRRWHSPPSILPSFSEMSKERERRCTSRVGTTVPSPGGVTPYVVGVGAGHHPTTTGPPDPSPGRGQRVQPFEPNSRLYQEQPGCPCECGSLPRAPVHLSPARRARPAPSPGRLGNEEPRGRSAPHELRQSVSPRSGAPPRQEREKDPDPHAHHPPPAFLERRVGERPVVPR